MNQLYSHRNGETEPPTISGRYWLKGHMPQGTKDEPWGYDFGEHEDVPYEIDAERGMIDLDGTCYRKPIFAFVGQFWGPVQMPVPPWKSE